MIALMIAALKLQAKELELRKKAKPFGYRGRGGAKGGKADPGAELLAIAKQRGIRVREKAKPASKPAKPLITPEELEAIEARRRAERALDDHRAEVKSALVNLGYRVADLQGFLRSITEPGDLEQSLRSFLSSKQPASVQKKTAELPKNAEPVTPVTAPVITEDLPTRPRPTISENPYCKTGKYYSGRGFADLTAESLITNFTKGLVIQSLVDEPLNESFFQSQHGDGLDDYILEIIRELSLTNHRLPRHPDQKAVKAVELCIIEQMKLNGDSAPVGQVVAAIEKAFKLTFPPEWDLQSHEADQPADISRAELDEMQSELARLRAQNIPTKLYRNLSVENDEPF